MSDCIIAKGYVRDNGYIQLPSSLMYAHRAAWVNAHGRIPDGLLVLHKCDVRSCINLEHLYLGTHQDNTNDMMDRKRCKTIKFDEDTIQTVRNMLDSGISRYEIHQTTGVSISQISHIKTGRRRSKIS